jgi:hypothetical protein
LILKRLLAGHDLAAIVVFLVQIVQHFWPGTRIVPQPVVVIDTRIAMRWSSHKEYVGLLEAWHSYFFVLHPIRLAKHTYDASET